MWMAYRRESPISDMRGDVQASIVAAAAFQAQGAKAIALDLLPNWNTDSKSPGMDRESAVEGEMLFKAYLAAAADTLNPPST